MLACRKWLWLSSQHFHILLTAPRANSLGILTNSLLVQFVLPSYFSLSYSRFAPFPVEHSDTQSSTPRLLCRAPSVRGISTTWLRLAPKPKLCKGATLVTDTVVSNSTLPAVLRDIRCCSPDREGAAWHLLQPLSPPVDKRWLPFRWHSLLASCIIFYILKVVFPRILNCLADTSISDLLGVPFYAESKSATALAELCCYRFLPSTFGNFCPWMRRLIRKLAVHHKTSPRASATANTHRRYQYTPNILQRANRAAQQRKRVW